jgi:hypothetical protein
MRQGDRIAIAVIAVVCACASGAAPAGAQNSRLTGTYAVTGTEACLNSPSGFNSSNQPNTVSTSFGTSASIGGTVTYDGSGHAKYNETFVALAVIATPDASSGTTTGSSSYTVAANGKFEIKSPNVAGTVLTGPRAGQTFIIDEVVLEGAVSADNSVTVTSRPLAIETITYSNGDTWQRICHSTGSAVQTGS